MPDVPWLSISIPDVFPEIRLPALEWFPPIVLFVAPT
jgi:hypothetical protein